MTAQLPSREMLAQAIERISDAIDDAARLYGENWDSALVGGEPNYHAITSDHTQGIVVKTDDDSLHSSWLCDYLEAVDPASIRLLLARIKELDKAAHEQDPVAYADPQAFDNFKSNGGNNAACTKEWMWRDNANGLIPLYTNPAPVPAVPDYYVVVTTANVWQTFCKTRAEADFIVSKPFHKGYYVLEVYTRRAAMLNGGKS